MLLVQLKSADVACGYATLRASPLSGQAAISSRLHHHQLLACHSRAALGQRIPEVSQLWQLMHDSAPLTI